MRKTKELNGLPVITFDTGKKIGEIKDTLFSPEHNRVLAFLVDEGGWFEEARVIPFESVKSVGRDAVIVPSAAVEVKLSQNLDIKSAFDSRRVITNMRAYSEDGRDLGTIHDVVIDELTGDVKGYEVSGGFLEETMKGKKFMPAPEMLTVGEQVVFVPFETATRMEEEMRGGLGRRVEEARKAGAVYVGEARERAQVAKEKAAASAREQQKRFVIGKTAQSEVRSPDGTIIVRTGEIITPDTADEADRRGVLGRLVSAVGGAEAQSLLSRIQAEASRAYEEARRVVTGTTERAQEESERKRIEDALGRPVTRVILDQQDRVILNTGEIVTNEAIRRAREAGILDVLLNSISKQEPSFGLEQRKAPLPGQARTEEQPQTGIHH